MHDEHQIPIWFFIGGTLLTYGLIIFGVGLYSLVVPAIEANIELRRLHADIWWGGVMAIVGAFYTVRFWPTKKQTLTGREE